MPAAHLLLRKIHSITAWVAKSKGRQEEPTAPTAARLIGCGGRAAAAAAAVVGTHNVDRFFSFSLVLHTKVCRQHYCCCFAQDI